VSRKRQLTIFACLSTLVVAQACAENVHRVSVAHYALKVHDFSAYRLQIRDFDHVLPQRDGRLARKPYASEIRRAARTAAIDPALVHAVIAVESGYDVGARSRKGAIGLMQVMPQTAQRYGVREHLRSAEVNLNVGTRYLSDLLALFGGRLDLVLAAYNAGEQAVLDHGRRVPPYPETQHYVKAVSKIYRTARGSAADAGRTEYLRGTRLAP
jgi:soluble lytic murein transglycosylase-like protein